MQTLNTILQLLLATAVFCYFLGFVASAPLRWQLWRWATYLIAAVFGIAGVVVEARVHPIAALFVLVFAALVSYRIVEVRRAPDPRAHRHTTPTFLNLRVTGKTPVETEAEERAHEDDEENQE